ncbi:HK97 gp10 family phage protein [Zhengella sp. ZM62]|uniref:HK97 gp10 family phage protein n=1 Tax=Zhengella sedimenti TaxID=3390035 RepID=UPI00397511A4
MAQNFTAQVDAWVKESKARIEAVVKESAQRVVEDMQKPTDKGGNMPVDTGFLRASIQGQLDAPVMTVRANPGGTYSYDGGDISMTLANMELGDVFYATYTANYARYVEYGANGRPGRAFVRTAAARWPQTVNEVASELKARSVR